MPRRYMLNICVAVTVTLLLIIAAGCHLPLKNISSSTSLALDYLRNSIYIGLVFVWGCSIQRRMMQSSVQKYLLLITGLLLILLVERTCKYLFLYQMPMLTRYFWYLYYIPMMLVPLLGIFAATHVGESDDYTPPKKMRLLYLPAFLLIAAVLTNDMHRLAFRFPGGVLNGGYDYSHGPLYFATVAWITAEALIILGVLLHKSRIPGKKSRVLLPACIMGIGLLYSNLNYYTEIPHIRYITGDMSVFFCFIIILTFEACVQTGLIQSNSHYDELFRLSTIGAQITDKEYRAVLSSETAKDFSPEVLRKAEQQPTILADGFRLSGIAIPGGHALWLEDVSSIANAISELESVNEELEDSVKVQQEENHSLKKKTRLKELNRLYHKMQLETADQIQCLQRHLTQLAAAEGEEEEKRVLGKIMVLGAYIKRRNNLLCVLEKQETTEAVDLKYCLNESIEALQMQGVVCGYAVEVGGEMNVRTIMGLYDAFEAVLEKTMDALKFLYVFVRKVQDGYVLLLEIGATVDAPTFLSERFECEAEGNGEWILTCQIGEKEGAV